MAFPDYPVVSMDSPVERAVYEKWRPEDWISQTPRAILDEAQKLPAIFDTVKACFDRSPEVRYLLLGSSQILLLQKVRETLAGRVAIRELYPFSLPELVSAFGGQPSQPSRLLRLLQGPNPGESMRKLFPPDLPLSSEDSDSLRAWDYFLRWGGMPAILGTEWTEQDRFEWLRDYHDTYLQRDLGDLARLDRLEPFVRAQKAAATKTAKTVNFSELARLSEVSPPTARQFIRYLEISYQVFLLPAWFRNQEKRLAKQPKLHFFDPGVRRAVLQKRGDVDGEEFESAVVAEICKQCRTARLPVELHHLHTVDGREVDLLVEREDGFIAIECKQASKVSPADFRHIKALDPVLDKPLLLGVVVSSDLAPRAFIEGRPPHWNVAAHQLLG
jgi:predicted AAA+ superfamily ATPase